MRYQVVDLPKIGADDGGYLSFFETGGAIDFEVRRLYYIYDTPTGVPRGRHAHRALKQALWAPAGVVELLLDDGHEKAEIVLDDPSRLVVLQPGLWRDFVFRTPGSALCVAASDCYDEADYVRDYDEFRRLVEGGYWS